MAYASGELPDGQQELAALYSRVAPIYAEQGPPFFGHAGRRLVDLAQVRPGAVILDVARGRGAVLIPAARRAGPAGQVVGIDIAPGMVDATRRSIRDQRLIHASVELMDAAHLGLQSEAFTHALSSFAVFLFPDVAGVLRELRRLLRPGGVVEIRLLARYGPRAGSGTKTSCATTERSTVFRQPLANRRYVSRASS